MGGGGRRDTGAYIQHQPTVQLQCCGTWIQVLGRHQTGRAHPAATSPWACRKYLCLIVESSWAIQGLKHMSIYGMVSHHRHKHEHMYACNGTLWHLLRASHWAQSVWMNDKQTYPVAHTIYIKSMYVNLMFLPNRYSHHLPSMYVARRGHTRPMCFPACGMTRACTSNVFPKMWHGESMLDHVYHQ